MGEVTFSYLWKNQPVFFEVCTVAKLGVCMTSLLFGIFRGRHQFFTHGCQKKCKQKIIFGFPLGYGNVGREMGILCPVL